MRSALAAFDRGGSPKLTPTSDLTPDVMRDLERAIRELREIREENAAVADQVQTEGRETVLAARDASVLAEAVYLEASEMSVALRELSRVIAEIRPMLESSIAPAGSANGSAAGLSQACRMLGEVADRYRSLAVRVAEEWEKGGPQGGGAPAMLEDLGSQLATLSERRAEAEKLIASEPSGGGSPRILTQTAAALKKLLQSAEIANERLTRLAAAAERSSSASRRGAGLAERELRSLEALGVRLAGEPAEDPAETLAESDLVTEPDRGGGA